MIDQARIDLQVGYAAALLEELRGWTGCWPCNEESRPAAARLAELLRLPLLEEPAAGAVALSLRYDAGERLELWEAWPSLLAVDPVPLTHICLFRLPSDPPLPVALEL